MRASRLAVFFSNRFILLAAYVIVAAGAAGVQYLKGKPGEPYTKYNNYLIFRESYHHLAEGTDLYAPDEERYFDLYKYSPAFAVLFAPFSRLTDLAGLIVWNLLNALPLLLLLLILPGLPGTKAACLAGWIILPELITSLQNVQSNGLVAALALAAYVSFERRAVFLAAACIMASAYIKVFGIVTALLFLLYDGRIRFLGWCALWFAVFALLPLAVTTPDLLWMQYKSWFALLQADSRASMGISVYGLMESLFGSAAGKNLWLMAGVVLLLLPSLFLRRYIEAGFRLRWLACTMIWVVIFNHRAESPTFVVAVTGVALWYAASDRTRLDNILMGLVAVLTILSPTDLFPRMVREQWVVPYSLKALPCVLVWMKLTWELVTGHYPGPPAHHGLRHAGTPTGS